MFQVAWLDFSQQTGELFFEALSEIEIFLVGLAAPIRHQLNYRRVLFVLILRLWWRSWLIGLDPLSSLSWVVLSTIVIGGRWTISRLVCGLRHWLLKFQLVKFTLKTLHFVHKLQISILELYSLSLIIM